MSVTGVKFNDVDGNGVQGSGESGLSGWVINAYVDDEPENGDLDPDEFDDGALESASTDSNGAYTLTLPPGKYIICEVAQAGWTQTAPAPEALNDEPECDAGDPDLGPQGYAIELVAENDTGNDFGNRRPGGGGGGGTSPFPATVTIIKDAVPDDPQDFSFTGNGLPDPQSFTLDDDQDGTNSNTQTFTVTSFDLDNESVTEGTLLEGWVLTSITCNKGTTDTEAQTATFNVQSGDSITCTFQNTRDEEPPEPPNEPEPPNQPEPPNEPNPPGGPPGPPGGPPDQPGGEPGGEEPNPGNGGGVGPERGGQGGDDDPGGSGFARGFDSFGTLPFTGFVLGSLLLAGCALLIAGFALRPREDRRSRRR
jgi:hypothetical protein